MGGIVWGLCTGFWLGVMLTIADEGVVERNIANPFWKELFLVLNYGGVIVGMVLGALVGRWATTSQLPPMEPAIEFPEDDELAPIPEADAGSVVDRRGRSGER